MTFRRILFVAWLVACIVLIMALRNRLEERRLAALATTVPKTAARPARAVRPVSRDSGDQLSLVQAAIDATAAEILDLLTQRLVRPNARENETVLTFKTAEAYQAFLARAKAAGLNVLAQSDELNVARIKYDSLNSLQNELMANTSDYSEVSANYFVTIPTTPTKEQRAAINEEPFGNKALDFLGIAGDRSEWGKGVTIAVLDSGVGGDDTFGTGRLRALDIGFGTAPGTGTDDGHGTAVAGLAAGASSDAPGVAPAAGILSIRVTGDDGMSDIYTISQAIVSAVKNGATVINISMGGYDSNAALNNAIAYATSHGAVIVASAGNDQAGQLTWPAADSRVVSVGAVDARGQQVMFSNSGDGLQLTAPGYGVQTAWLNGERITMDGTSASAPLVAGSVAAILSANPALTPQEAVQILQKYSSDAGAPGADSDYGIGTLNVGWAMNRNNTAYADTAISSHYYDAATGTMEFVIQNRGGQSASGMNLVVGTGDANSIGVLTVPTLSPGASTVLKLPVNATALQASGGITFTTVLTNPAGVADRVPANNRKVSVLTPPAGE